MSEAVEDQADDAEPRGGSPAVIRSVTDARREASTLYWEWKRGKRKLKPHECAVLIGALGNIASMIEKERDNRIKELEEKIERLEKAQAEKPQLPCQPPAQVFASVN